jgi:hypothetical protein
MVLHNLKMGKGKFKISKIYASKNFQIGQGHTSFANLLIQATEKVNDKHLLLLQNRDKD